MAGAAALDCFCRHDKREKKRLSAVLRATEYLFFENIALKLLLEHSQIANWQKLLDHLLSDKEIMAGVRLKFSDLYRELEASKDPLIRPRCLLRRTSGCEETALASIT